MTADSSQELVLTKNDLGEADGGLIEVLGLQVRLLLPSHIHTGAAFESSLGGHGKVQ